MIYNCGDIWKPNGKNNVVHIIMARYKNKIFYIRQHQSSWTMTPTITIKKRIQNQLIRVSISQFKKHNKVVGPSNNYYESPNYFKIIESLMDDTDFLIKLAETEIR